MVDVCGKTKFHKKREITNLFVTPFYSLFISDTNGFIYNSATLKTAYPLKF